MHVDPSRMNRRKWSSWLAPLFARAILGVTLIIAISFTPACASTTVDPVDRAILVAGSYPTAVSLTENTCGSGITVQSMTTVVTHSAGSSTLTLQHGPITYSGTVSSNGSFSTQAAVFNDVSSGTQSTLTVAGQFSTTGLVADVSVAVVRTGLSNCAYKVHWVATKTGTPNVIP